MFHIFLHKYLIRAVMKTQLLIYNTQQMRYANTIVCNIMSVLLYYVSAVIYFYILTKMNAHWNKLIETWRIKFVLLLLAN